MTPGRGDTGAAPVETGRCVVRCGNADVTLAWAAATHAGNRRALNEDSLCAAPPVFCVADGVGGHEGGEVASALAVGTMAVLRSESGIAEQALRAAVTDAHRAILQQADTSLRTMGTTLTGLALADEDEPTVLVVNVGDSRTYCFADRTLHQVSVDHSAVQELVDAGHLTAADARNHPNRNIITRALGGTTSVDPDVFAVPAAAGQRWLACSDGLTGELADTAIAAHLAHGSAVDAARALMTATLDGPARDNVSVVVVDVLQIGRRDLPGRTGTQSRSHR